MKIGIDISQVVYEGTGVARFTEHIIESILQYNREHTWTFFFSSFRRHIPPHIKKRILNSPHRLLKYRLPPTALSFLWNDLHRLKIEKLTGVLDWFITSDWAEGPSHMKKATIVHDMIYRKYPETLPSSIINTQNKRMNWIKKESKIIFVDSLTTKNDLIEETGIRPEKIVVNYPGVTIEKPTQTHIKQVKRQFNLHNPFILTVGKLEPRKNIQNLIHAVESLHVPHLELLIVGPKGWDYSVQKINKDKVFVRFLNYVSDPDLAALYTLCDVFVYPSLYEGFGFPVVEAMKLGAAVATSNTSSLHEIAHNSCLEFNPFDIADIAEKINTILHDTGLKRKIIKQSIIKSADFTWKGYFETLITTLINN